MAGLTNQVPVRDSRAGTPLDNYIHAFRYTKKSCWEKLIPLIIELLILFSIPHGRFRLLFFVSNVVDRIMAFSVTEPHSQGGTGPGILYQYPVS